MIRDYLLGWGAHRGHRSFDYLGCPRGATTVLFANRRLRPYSDNKLREKHLRPLLKSLGMKAVGFHAIRHGVASELINSGTPITAVRDQMRHSDVRVT